MNHTPGQGGKDLVKYPTMPYETRRNQGGRGQKVLRSWTKLLVQMNGGVGEKTDGREGKVSG